MGRVEYWNDPAAPKPNSLVPVSGTPTVNDEASDVRWAAPGDLEALDIHPTQWRQLRDWLTRSWPHVD